MSGEVVVLEAGRPSLAGLQQRAQLSNPARIEILSKRRPVTLMVFDLLYLRYKNVMAQPLVDRRGCVGPPILALVGMGHNAFQRKLL